MCLLSFYLKNCCKGNSFSLNSIAIVIFFYLVFHFLFWLALILHYLLSIMNVNATFKLGVKN